MSALSCPHQCPTNGSRITTATRSGLGSSEPATATRNALEKLLLLLYVCVGQLAPSEGFACKQMCGPEQTAYPFCASFSSSSSSASHICREGELKSHHTQNITTESCLGLGRFFGGRRAYCANHDGLSADSWHACKKLGVMVCVSGRQRQEDLWVLLASEPSLIGQLRGQ